MKIHTLKQSPNLGVCMRTYYREEQEIEISPESIISLKETVCYIDNGRYPIDCCIIGLNTSKEVITPLNLEKIEKLFNFTSEKLSNLLKS